MTITDLKLDWEPLPYTQGTILSVVGDTQEVIYRPDPGYERMLGAMRQDDGRCVRIYAFDRETLKLTPYQMRTGVRPVVEGRGVFKKPEADGTYRIKITEEPNGPSPILTPAQQGMAAGTAVAVAIEGAKRVSLKGNTFIQSGNLPWHGWKRQPERYGQPIAVYEGSEIEIDANKVGKLDLTRFKSLDGV